MTDAEIIAELSTKATEIMHEPKATETGDPKRRADRLEIAARYMTCCAILTGEIPYDKMRLMFA